MIYLDNAASSWPKPRRVMDSMLECMQEYAANPGRSSHRLAMKAASQVERTRALLGKLFHVKNPENIIFTHHATEALNLAIKGTLVEGDHVVTSSLEHNSVRRPLEYLKSIGLIDVTYVEPGPSRSLSAECFIAHFTRKTKLVVCTHGSNVTGEILPIGEIGRAARTRGILFLVDAAQTAGSFPIDVEDMCIDMLAFTGHKALFGPQGTGGLYIHPEVDVKPLLHGGTGGYSERADQPPVRPERYESGTLNTVGIVGLGAGVQYILDIGIDKISEHKKRITDYCYDKLKKVPGVTIVGPDQGRPRTHLLSFSLDGYDSHEVATILDMQYDIAVRSGLHCAPLAHMTTGTEENGLVRASFSYHTTFEEIDRFVEAVYEIAVSDG
jgi:cysteine desulfurase family protein